MPKINSNAQFWASLNKTCETINFNHFRAASCPAERDEAPMVFLPFWLTTVSDVAAVGAVLAPSANKP
jgi:hypothetical protein